MEEIIPSDWEKGDAFGYSMSIWNNTILIGAPKDDVDGDKRGSAYIMKLNSDATWTETKLLAPDSVDGDRFGLSVSIYQHIALISAPATNGGIGPYTNETVYFFEEDCETGEWIQTATLTKTGGFGFRVAVYQNYAVISSVHDQLVYIFERMNESVWIERDVLVSSDKSGRYLGSDNFGSDISIYGEYIVVTAMDANWDEGAVYLFERQDDGTWTEVTKLLSRGSAVDMHEDYVVIGADYTNEVFILERDNNTGLWQQTAFFVDEDDPDPNGYEFGKDVSIYNNYMIANSYKGAYIYERLSNGKWIKKDTIDLGEEYQYGLVSVYDDHFLVANVVYGHEDIDNGDQHVFSISNYSSFNEKDNGDKDIDKDIEKDIDGDIGLIVGAVIGVLIFVLIIFSILFVLWRKLKNKEMKELYKADINDNEGESEGEGEGEDAMNENGNYDTLNNKNGESITFLGETEGEINMKFDVKEWFRNEVDLEEYYINLLIENGFDNIKSLKQMTNDNMIEIGITKLHHRKLIISLIQNLQY